MYKQCNVRASCPTNPDSWMLDESIIGKSDLSHHMSGDTDETFEVYACKKEVIL